MDIYFTIIFFFRVRLFFNIGFNIVHIWYLIFVNSNELILGALKCKLDVFVKLLIICGIKIKYRGVWYYYALYIDKSNLKANNGKSSYIFRKDDIECQPEFHTTIFRFDEKYHGIIYHIKKINTIQYIARIEMKIFQCSNLTNLSPIRMHWKKKILIIWRIEQNEL